MRSVEVYFKGCFNDVAATAAVPLSRLPCALLSTGRAASAATLFRLQLEGITDGHAGPFTSALGGWAVLYSGARGGGGGGGGIGSATTDAASVWLGYVGGR